MLNCCVKMWGGWVDLLFILKQITDYLANFLKEMVGSGGPAKSLDL